MKKIGKYSQFIPDLKSVEIDISNHSQLGVEYKLANLGVFNEVLDRLGKYDIYDHPLDERCVNFTMDYFFSKINQCLFLDETIAYSEMNKAASVGFGAKLSGIDSRHDPRLESYMFDYVNRSIDEVTHCLISGSQKDEIRPSHKTPRLFTSFPPEHTYAAAICLGDFLRQFYSRHFCVDGSVSAVGDSPQKGCMVHYRIELSKRPFIYCTDTSGQDASVNPQFIRRIYENIFSKMSLTHEEKCLFWNTMDNSIYKYINIAGNVYLVPRGLGSGDYLTVVINIMWRLYMIFENYNHNLYTYFDDNTTVINGDDLTMSSQYNDLDLNSKHAQIEWLGRPLIWEEADFCSCKFEPNIHLDKTKMLAVLNLRKNKAYQFSPTMEMSRLGGLLRVHVDEEFYNIVLNKMIELDKQFNLNVHFVQNFVTYEEVFESYNCYNEEFD
jgi:hypothetical protein